MRRGGRHGLTTPTSQRTEAIGYVISLTFLKALYRQINT